MSKKGIKLKVKMPVLGAKVTFLIGSYDQIAKWIPESRAHFFDDDPDNSYVAMCSYELAAGGKYPFDVVIHSREFELSAIVHEIVHAVNLIQAGMGVVADFNNDELSAYMTDHLFHKVDKAYRKFSG